MGVCWEEVVNHGDAGVAHVACSSFMHNTLDSRADGRREGQYR